MQQFKLIQSIKQKKIFVARLTDEGVGPDDVEGGDPENLVWVVDAGSLEHLWGDGDRGVDGVGDDGNHRVGAHLLSTWLKVINIT